MAGPSSFWDRMADKYAAQPIADQAAYQTKLEVTRTYLRPEMDLLEFGCGTGGTALLHAPFVRHITAIDFSPRMIEIARTRAADTNIDNVDFREADIVTFPAPDGAYDAILGMSILHLLENHQKVIARVWRLLKPGGVFISSTACVGDTMGFIKYIAPLGTALGLLPHLNVMTTSQLRADLITAGFEIAHQWEPGRGKAVFIVARKP